MATLTYISHSCFTLSNGTHSIIIDPFLTGNPTATITASDVAPTHIVLTHSHGDHLGDALDLAKRHDALVIAVNELANYVAGKGARAHNMHIGGGYNFPFGRLKFTIAHHGSSTPDGEYMGEPAGVVISFAGKTIYHSGDTGLFLDMKLIGELDPIDYALLPIGDNFTMGIPDAVMATEFLKPKMVIPMHYNTWEIISADPSEFKAKVEAKGFVCRVLNFGESMEL